MEHWDPMRSPDWDSAKTSGSAVIRLKKDISDIYKDPPPGLVILPNPEDISKLHALVTGPFDTPYEGGYFLFCIRCPPNYPIKPPRVRLMTTGNGMVRFNPNFYKDGKVCLSILGTWSGPGWSPAQSLSSLLISIQSLMTENPYHNEPGFAKERVAGDSHRYNQCIRHETLRVAVCDMVDSPLLSEEVKKIVHSSFLEYYDYYVATCNENISLDGRPLSDPFNANKGIFKFGYLLSRLKALKEKFSNNLGGEAMEVDEPGCSNQL